MKPNQTIDWEKEFNELWNGNSKEGRIGLLTIVLTADGDGGAAKLLKSFIRDIINQERKQWQSEVVERLEGLRLDLECGHKPYQRKICGICKDVYANHMTIQDAIKAVEGSD